MFHAQCSFNAGDLDILLYFGNSLPCVEAEVDHFWKAEFWSDLSTVLYMDAGAMQCVCIRYIPSLYISRQRSRSVRLFLGSSKESLKGLLLAPAP